MIGRDRVVVRWKNADGDPVEKVLAGRVITEQQDGKLEPLGGRLHFVNFYRLLMPHSLDLSGAREITVSFKNRTNVKLETPIVPVYDGRGGIRHYEGVVRSS